MFVCVVVVAYHKEYMRPRYSLRHGSSDTGHGPLALLIKIFFCGERALMCAWRRALKTRHTSIGKTLKSTCVDQGFIGHTMLLEC